MKRTFLVTIMMLVAGIIAFAQQSDGTPKPTSAETRQNAQQTLTQAKSNSSKFESTLSSLKTQNTSTGDAATYKRLKAQLEQLELSINREQARMQASIDLGQKVSSTTVDEIQKLIDQYKAAMTEMEAFISH